MDRRCHGCGYVNADDTWKIIVRVNNVLFRQTNAFGKTFLKSTAAWRPVPWQKDNVVLRGLFSTDTLKKKEAGDNRFDFLGLPKARKAIFLVRFFYIFYHFLSINTCFNKLFTAFFYPTSKKWAHYVSFFVLATNHPIVFIKKYTWWLRS